MQTLLQDLRYAVRQLRKSPGFTLTAVITLALGIGANTAIFTLVQGILLRSLPVADPSRLYRIGDTDNCCVNGGFVGRERRLRHLLLRPLSAVQASGAGVRVAGRGRGRAVAMERAAREYAADESCAVSLCRATCFSTLGVGPYEGRVFTESDDQPSAAPVVVLSYRSWQSEFGGDPAIVGQTISIQAHPFTIIGIAPPVVLRRSSHR